MLIYTVRGECNMRDAIKPTAKAAHVSSKHISHSRVYVNYFHIVFYIITEECDGDYIFQ